MEDSFYERVYRAVAEIPKGRVATYGQIAFMAGKPRGARIVGYALHRNPYPGIVPCHRVVFRDGRLTPSFAFGGEDIQRQLLQAEGVVFCPDGSVDMARSQWDGSSLQA